MVAPLARAPSGHGSAFLATVIRRPALSLGIVLIAALAGFATAAMVDSRVPIRAEGDSNETDGRNADRKKLVLNDSDPDVWPKLESSFPSEIDLLNPEPLISPIRSLGPARADVGTLIAALKNAANPSDAPPEQTQPSVPTPSPPEIKPTRRSLPPKAKLAKPERVLQKQLASSPAPVRPKLRAVRKKNDPSPADQTNSTSNVPDLPRLFD